MELDPEVVLAHLEKPISGTGVLEVGVILPEVAFGNERPLVERTARLAGRSYRAHVTGGLRRFGSVKNLFMHGVALGDELVLADTPMRPLEPGEALDPKKRVLAKHPVNLHFANPFTPKGTGPFFAEDGEGYHCLCCCDVGWESYDAYLGTRAAGGSGDAAAIGRAYNNTGAKSLLLIPVEFPDELGSPWSSDAIRASRVSGIQDYYNTTSYGTFTLPTVDTATLQLMEQDSTYYETEGHTVLKNDAATKARDAGYDADSYEFVSIVINHNLYSWVGRDQLGKKYSWIDNGNDWRLGTDIMEIGHNLGLWHANAWNPATSTPDDTNGTHVEYGHDFDVMGSSWRVLPRQNTF